MEKRLRVNRDQPGGKLKFPDYYEKCYKAKVPKIYKNGVDADMVIFITGKDEP